MNSDTERLIWKFVFSEISQRQLKTIRKVCQYTKQLSDQCALSKIWHLPADVNKNKEGLWAFEAALGDRSQFGFEITQVDPNLGSDRKLMLGLCWEDGDAREYVTVSSRGSAYLQGMLLSHVSFGELHCGDSIRFYFDRNSGGSLQVAINDSERKAINKKRLHSRSSFRFTRVWAVAYVFTRDYKFEPSLCDNLCGD